MGYKYLTKIQESIEKNVTEINKKKAFNLGGKIEVLREYE